MALTKVTDINEKKSDYIDSGMKFVEDVSNKLFTLYSVQNLQLLRIGKPTGFHKLADPKSRIKHYMESKMNVIDIVPCTVKIPLTKAFEKTNPSGDSEILEALIPSIDYKDSIGDFQNVCNSYGLDNKFGGLRLYITDETTSTDQFDVQHTDNMLESAINAVSDKGRTFRDTFRSASGSYDRLASNFGTKIGESTFGFAGGVVDSLAGNENEELKKNLAKLGGAVGRAVALGQKFSLPKIWSDSNYTPNMNAVVKLVSPYGHPDAIKEFIIKPLMYLLIIASSRTTDGISYRAAPKLSIKAYGVANFPLASISGITVRRGGADTSFNIFRQPLSVDVSLTFQTLVNGFAAFDSAGKDPSGGLFKDSNIIRSDINNAQAGRRALFPTLGTYLESLKPVAINKIATEHNIKNLPNMSGLDLTKIPSEELRDHVKGTEDQMNANKRLNINSKGKETATEQTKQVVGNRESLIIDSKFRGR